MSDPYIIWAMRRTGGTTLAALLSSLSEHPNVEHEPFNQGRVFGAVTAAWREGRNRRRLRADIAAALEKRPVIKHCYEIMPPELNRTLMEVATELGYRHIVLDRRAESDRILSLELARITGAWGGKDAKRIYGRIAAGEQELAPVEVGSAVAHLHECRRHREALERLLAASRQTPFVVYFEDIYSDPAQGRQRVGRLLAFLGIDPAEHPDYEARLTDALLNRGQNSARILSSVPNISEARTALAEAAAKSPPLFEPS
ncbi:hypothetical protein KUV62_22090 [Salipiger bermudensis]|uniref:hypothetical protein n=1 Tax=Salipiger bermudensis TaxID=344736 RepID=UPI001C99D2C1|nr:hypothetical protein [Salipiger bermudensis]MBY6006631.1 hypothetical protein [Salipiger bermudensis]